MKKKETENKTEQKKDLTIEELRNRSYKDDFEDIYRNLQACFQNDFTIEEACSYVGINPDTYYEWCKLSTEFREKMHKAKRFLFFSGKQYLRQAALGVKDKDGNWVIKPDIKIIQWVLKRRQKDQYSPRLESTGAEGKPLHSEPDYSKLSDKELANLEKLLRKTKNG